MRTAFFPLLPIQGCAAGPASLAATWQAERRIPNAVVILAADLCSPASGSYSGEIRKPNLDWPAENPLPFTQVYNTAGIE
jgi:hypothetical protein